MTDDIVSFLKARIEEYEQAACERNCRKWPSEEHEAGECDECDRLRRKNANEDAREEGPFEPLAVLAGVEARRRIMSEYEARDQDVDLMLGPDCERQREWVGLRLAVQLLATEWSSHQDYQQVWRL